MNFKEKRSFNENGVQGRVYETDDSFTADRLINLFKGTIYCIYNK